MDIILRRLKYGGWRAEIPELDYKGDSNASVAYVIGTGVTWLVDQAYRQSLANWLSNLFDLKRKMELPDNPYTAVGRECFSRAEELNLRFEVIIESSGRLTEADLADL